MSKQNREQKLIQLIKDLTQESRIGDDCALINGNILLSSDMLVEETHFLLPQIHPADLGYKAMAVNFSDIAAMGGKIKYALVNIGIPKNFSDRTFRILYQSMIDCAKEFHCQIIGGDLTASKKLCISITVVGYPHKEGILTRKNAKPNQVLITTGDYAASALGLKLILQDLVQGKSKPENHPHHKHCHPQPRLFAGEQLAHYSKATAAAMDTSDGLADALIQIAIQSKVKIVVNENLIPIHPQTINMASDLLESTTELALYGGEDYELIACLDKEDWHNLQKDSACQFKLIGNVYPGEGAHLLKNDNTIHELSHSLTFQHWSNNIVYLCLFLILSKPWAAIL